MTDYPCPVCAMDTGKYPAVSVTHILVRETIGHRLPILKPSKYRSKRQRKKLNKRLATRIEGHTAYMQIGPKAANTMRKYLHT